MAQAVSLESQLDGFLRLHVDNPDAVLIGGQALATWVHALNIEPPLALKAGISGDLDYLASRQAAVEHHYELAKRGLAVQLYLPEAGDFTPNSAKLVIAEEGAAPIEIDYMAEMYGFDVEAKAQLIKRAVPIKWSNGELRVMHPFDCLKSRVSNLSGLPQKQNKLGLAQLRLSIDVGARFLALNCGSRETTRAVVLPMTQRIVLLARSRHGMKIFREWGVDVLDAIPAELIGGDFQAKRWPQIQKQMIRKRFGRHGGNRRLATATAN